MALSKRSLAQANQLLEKETDVKQRVKIIKKIKKYEKLRGFITEYNSKFKHKRMKG